MPPSLRTVVLAILAVLAVALVAACAPEVDARLLTVDAVSTTRLEATGRLAIEGDGFPPGRQGRVVFRGTMHRPAAAPEPIVAEAPATAVSRERVEVRGSTALMTRLGGRGTFEGSVRVVFDAADGEGVVSGSLGGVVFDVIDTTTFTGEAALARTRRARRFLDDLGIEEARDTTGQGIVIDHVAPGGLAERAALQKGDRIVALGGLHIDTLADLAPADEASVLTLVVARPGEAEPFDVRVATGYEPTLLGRAPLVPLALLAALAAVVLTLTPVARRVHSWGVALTSSHGASAHRELLSLHASPSPSVGSRGLVDMLRRGAWAIVAMLSAATALGVLPFMAHRVHGGVGVGFLALVVLGARAMAELSAEPSAEPAKGAPAAHRPLTALVVPLATSTLPLAAAVGVAAMASGSLRLAGIVLTQGGAPWRWAVFTSPAGLVAFAALVFAVLVDGRRPGAPRARSASYDVAERVRLFLGSGIATALFLGGWQLPFVEGDPLEAAPTLRVVGALVFIVKAWLVMIAVVRLRNGLASEAATATAKDIEAVAPRRLVRAFLPSLFAVAAFAVGVLTLVSPLPAELADAVGPVTFAMVGVVAVAHLRAAHRTRTRDEEVIGIAPFA